MLVRSRKARARRSRALSVLSSIIGVFFEAHVPEKYLDFHCILSGALVASLSIKRIKKERLRLFFFCFRRNCYCGGIIQLRLRSRNLHPFFAFDEIVIAVGLYSHLTICKNTAIIKKTTAGGAYMSDIKTIAVIDDDVYIGDMLEELLKKEGYDVLRAYSGTEALYLFSEMRPFYRA